MEDNEVIEDDKVAYNSFMEMEDLECNESEDDDVDRSNAENISDSIDNNEDSNNEVRNKDDSDGNLLMDDDEEVPIERKHPSRFNVEDQRPYFSLGMTFANPYEVRESIRQYDISRGVALKFVKNEKNRIKFKHEDQCPFVLVVSKDNSNPRLTVKP